MTDRIYLSLWLKNHSGVGPLAALDRSLEAFPVSQFKPTAMLRVFALELAEPSVVDREFEDANVDEILEAAGEFENPDSAYEVTLHWDLWQNTALEDQDPANAPTFGALPGDTAHSDRPGWSLRPSPVRIIAFGPEFHSDLGEQVLVDLGLDHLYLPGDVDDPDNPRPNWTALRSNVRSLLRLSTDIESRLPTSKRTLWSDSEDDLADRLEEVMVE